MKNKNKFLIYTHRSEHLDGRTTTTTGVLRKAGVPWYCTEKKTPNRDG